MSSERDFHYNPILDGMFRPWVWILNISSKKKKSNGASHPPLSVSQGDGDDGSEDVKGDV